MKIPNVCILIPGIHSKVLFFPKYAVPLFARQWNPVMEDPAVDFVKEIPFPAGTNTEDFRFRNVDSVGEEKAYWYTRFAPHDGGTVNLFDLVYPADTFETMFESMLEKLAAAPPAKLTDAAPVSVPKVILELPGVDREIGIALARGGFKDLATIAGASLSALGEVDGMTPALSVSIRAVAAERSGLAASTAETEDDEVKPGEEEETPMVVVDETGVPIEEAAE